MAVPGTIVGPQDLLNQANALKQKALEIMGDPEGDMDEAERLLKEASEYGQKSERLNALRSQAEALTLDQVIEEPHKQQAANPAKEQHKKNGRKINPDGNWILEFGTLLRAIKKYYKTQGGQADPILRYFSEGGPSEEHALSESVGADGGFLVPLETLPGMMAQAMEMALVRSRATIIPMTRRQIGVPRLKQSGTTAGVPHWFGGMVTYWEGEAATIQQSQPAFEALDMLAYKLTAYVMASDELLDDSAQSLAAIITGPMGFPGAVGWQEDWAFLRGTGVGQPLGILNSGVILTQTRAGTAVAWEDLTGMVSMCLEGGNYIWIANPAVRADLMNMNGPSGNPVYLWGNAVQGQPSTLMGDPIFFSEKMPAAGSAGDLVRVDLSHYWIGDRQRTTIDISTEVGFLTGQTAWKVTHRVGGRPWLDSPFTLADGEFQVSPFVQLGAESST